MNTRFAIVVTTINAPTTAVKEIQANCHQDGPSFYVVGDSKSPPDFRLDGASYLDLEAQRATGFRFAELCPTRHYARKNVGYLAAMRDGAQVIVETDDDNIPRQGFWAERVRLRNAPLVGASQTGAPGWVNAYAYFSDGLIWPRGLPLNRIHDPAAVPSIASGPHDCPVQQGLADDNPDVDAIYRLVMPLPVSFAPGREIVLDQGAWCPFNSQNTTWWRDAFALLYLPYHCSFRMTDIWRSFVAQRLMWECDWRLSFHSSTVYQERNAHDLMQDFADEVPGYLNNERIRLALQDLPLTPGQGAIAPNLLRCYEALVRLGVIGPEEIPLLRAWLDDVESALA